MRSNEGTVKDGIAHQPRTFSLSAVSENEMEKSDWLVDPTSDFANVEARLFVESAMEMLSPLEQEIFSSCLLGEMPIRQFAERNGMRKSTAWDMANSIKKKTSRNFLSFPGQTEKKCPFGYMKGSIRPPRLFP